MGPWVATNYVNLKSLRELPEVVARKIAKECEASRIVGLSYTQTLLRIVPKKIPGQFRLILVIPQRRIC